jgi:hypothetical protein
MYSESEKSLIAFDLVIPLLGRIRNATRKTELFTAVLPLLFSHQ